MPEITKHIIKEIRPRTVKDLIKFLSQFDQDCELKALNYGAFRFVLDGEGNGQIQYA